MHHRLKRQGPLLIAIDYSPRRISFKRSKDPNCFKLESTFFPDSHDICPSKVAPSHCHKQARSVMTCDLEEDLALQVTVRERYEAMSKAIEKCGRPMLYSMCEWGVSNPWLYGKQVSLWPGPLPYKTE